MFLFLFFLEIPLNYDLDRLTFQNFDVAKVLEKGARLMGSEGTEFDCQDDFEVDSRENLQRQRSLLNERLGFDNNSSLGINLNDLVTLDDMRHMQFSEGPSGMCQNGNNSDQQIQRLLPVHELLRQSNNKPVSSHSTADSLSCREMNRFKRKARQNTMLPSSNGGASSSGTSTLSRSSSTASNGQEYNNGSEPERKLAKLEIRPEGNIGMLLQ